MVTPTSYVEPISFDFDFDFDDILMDEELIEMFEEIDNIGKKSNAAGVAVSVILSLLCTGGIIAVVYKKYKKDETTVVSMNMFEYLRKKVLVVKDDKSKQADDLVDADNDAAFDANELIRQRKSEESNDDDDQKTQGGTTLKSRNITPFDVNEKEEAKSALSFNATSDHISKQIDRVFQENKMLNPQELQMTSGALSPDV